MNVLNQELKSILSKPDDKLRIVIKYLDTEYNANPKYLSEVFGMDVTKLSRAEATNVINNIVPRILIKYGELADTVTVLKNNFTHFYYVKYETAAVLLRAYLIRKYYT